MRRPADCNDANPGIRPGAPDAPDDGVDQDCSGTDATNLDVDGDGSPRPQDCNDADRRSAPAPARWPATASTRTATPGSCPFPAISGVVSNLWRAAGSRTVNVALTAKDFPKGTRIELRCSGRGCPFRKVTRRVTRGRRDGEPAPRPSATAPSRRGARVELRLTRSGRIGRVLRFRIGSAAGEPSVDFLCQPPGKRIRDC